MTTNPDMPESQALYSTSPLLDDLNCIRHGFFGSQGGVSRDLYASLNCAYSSSDKRENVSTNRQRVAALFDLDEDNLFSLKQAHTTRVVELGGTTSAQFDTIADAMVSATPGVGLGALGADCAPVLYVEPVKGIIGAAHSGWKGALTGVNEAVILAMCQLGADRSNIHAAIGPAMQQQHYEVQQDFKAQFLANSDIDPNPFFVRRKQRLYFDTPGYIHARLKVAGIEHIEQSTEDTFSQPGRYFSYRRACQQGAQDYGRQIAVISLR